MIAELQAWLTSGNTSLPVLCVGIVLLSYLLEDLAIATAATVSVQGHLSPSLALLSIFIGIASGDVGLYLLGRYARNVRWLRYRALTHTSFNVVREKLTQRAFANLFLIRFIPGLRTIGFTLSGFFSIPLPLFMSAVLLATSLWTLVVFTLIYQLGNVVFSALAEWKWGVIPLAFVLLFLMNRFLTPSFTRGKL
ncbi:membrane protein [Marinomonas pontica]|uniref:Membrane protein n=1 Tax=Marinomonas pontica TaxID=264739 RepID=A0ABN6WJY6_9GAMM|nr:membrane protein [Marinomonas pontica]